MLELVQLVSVSRFDRPFCSSGKDAIPIRLEFLRGPDVARLFGCNHILLAILFVLHDQTVPDHSLLRHIRPRLAASTSSKLTGAFAVPELGKSHNIATQYLVE